MSTAKVSTLVPSASHDSVRATALEQENVGGGSETDQIAEVLVEHERVQLESQLVLLNSGQIAGARAGQVGVRKASGGRAKGRGPLE